MKIFIIILNILFILNACQSHPLHENTMIHSESIISAVLKNDTTKVLKELNNGVSVNTTDAKKRSLLLLATNNALTEMAYFLVKHGADVNQQADNQDSPFLYAGATGQTELVELYLKNGARFDIFNRYHGTALIPACERGHIETVQLLAYTKDFPLNHVNRLGWTGLMEAIILGNGDATYQKIVQILKNAGARMDIADHDNITPLEHAKRRGFEKIVQILQE